MAFVMGTGITAIALSLDGHRYVFRALLGLAAVGYAVAAAVLVARAVTDGPRAVVVDRAPFSLATIPATAVLGGGSLILGWRIPATIALALSVLLLALVAPGVACRMPKRVAGAWFLLVVAAQGSATAAADCAIADGAPWLCWVAVALASAGAATYPLVAWRFALGDLAHGDGDHWIAGGSIAITVLAAARIDVALQAQYPSLDAGNVMPAVIYALWGLAVVWIAPLVLAELCHPRLQYRPVRWSTVFPVGMYAACSFSAASATGSRALLDFARVWVWVAAVVWAVVFAGMGRHAAVGDWRPRMRANNAARSSEPPG
jgi:hypothetical protein